MLDLEDAVAADAKDAARESVRAWAADATPADRARVVVRTNDLGSPHAAADLAAVADAGLPAVDAAQDGVGRRHRGRAVRRAGRESSSRWWKAHAASRRPRRSPRHPGSSGSSSAPWTTRSTSTWIDSRSTQRRRALLRRGPTGRGVPVRRDRHAGRRGHTAAGRRGPAAGGPRLVPPARLRREAVHPPGPGRGDPRRAAPRPRRPSSARGACSRPTPVRPVRRSSTAA